MVEVALPWMVCCQLRGDWCIVFEEGESSSPEVGYRPLGTTIAIGRRNNVSIASIYYYQHSYVVRYVLEVLWRRTIVVIRMGLVGSGGSNSLVIAGQWTILPLGDKYTVALSIIIVVI